MAYLGGHTLYLKLFFDVMIFRCHDILIWGKSLVNWRQRPDKTKAVDWDVKHQFNQRNKNAAHVGVRVIQTKL